MRTHRLLTLIDILSKGEALSIKELSVELSVSERTIFRDIKVLRNDGAEIEISEHGKVILKQGWAVAPLQFTAKELEALSLGLNWVSEHSDDALHQSAKQALNKVKNRLSLSQRDAMTQSPHIIAPKHNKRLTIDVDRLLLAIYAEHKIQIHYVDSKSDASIRTVWPFALAHYDDVILLIAWCELREDFRCLRLDRMTAITYTATHYPNSRLGLYQLWLEQELVNNRAH